MRTRQTPRQRNRLPIVLALVAGCIGSPWFQGTALCQTTEPETVVRTLSPNYGEFSSLEGTLESSRYLQKEKAGTFRVPTIQFQISTPSDYLRGNRDDFEKNWQGSQYSEYSFELSGKNVHSLVFRNTAVTDVSVKPVHESYGLQLLLTHQLFESQRESNSPDFGNLEFSYGLRYQNLYDTLQVYASGGLLQRFESQTVLGNDYLGPQVALQWSKEKFGLNFHLITKIMAGYNFVDATHTHSIGSYNLAPGAVKRPATAQALLLHNNVNREHKATLTELRALVSYPLTSRLTLSTGYTSIYFSELERIENLDIWSLPGVGSLTAGDRAGFWSDQLHASIEWRR